MSGKFAIALRGIALGTAMAASLTGAALAQTAAPTTPKAEATLPSGQVPATLLNAPCADPPAISDATQLMRICWGKPVTAKPSVSFMVLKAERPVSREDHIRSNRDALHERKITEATEDDFSPATLPGSVGVRAYYRTDSGERIIWSVYHDERWYKVIVFAFSEFDAKAATAEIEAKVFGIGKP